MWIVEDGEIHPWDGDFEDYKNDLIREIGVELDEQEVRFCVALVERALRLRCSFS